MGFAHKYQCVEGSWDGFQYRSTCYTDILPLYTIRGMDDDTFPYVDHPEKDTPDTPLHERHGFVEYPVVTGLFMWYAARLGTWQQATFGVEETGGTFLGWNAAMLALTTLATVTLLWHLVPDRRRIALFAAAPTLVYYAFHNWDLLAVFFLVLGIYYAEKRNPFGAGAALALGASSKLFPILVIPFAFIHFARADHLSQAKVLDTVAQFFRVTLWRCRQAWRMVAAAVATLVVVNGPFLIWGSSDLWLETYRFHARRTPNFETPWAVASHYGRKWDIEWLARISDEGSGAVAAATFLFVLVYAWLLLWMLHRGAPLRQAALGAVLAFLIFNKIFSAQYALWVIPFFALLPLRREWVISFFAIDFWAYVTVFSTFDTFGKASFDSSHMWMSWAVLARLGWLVALLVALVADRYWRTLPADPGLNASIEASTARAVHDA